MRIRRFLHILLIVIACLLLWQIVEIWRRPLGAYPPPVPQRREEGSPPLSGRTPSPQTGKRYVDIIADKDLFSPTRSRTIREATPAATVPPPSHLKLVGVVLARGGAEAFFADATQGGKVVRLTTGESLGAYKLVDVTPSQATLKVGRDGDQVNLPLLVLDSQSAAQAPRLQPAGVRTAQSRTVQQHMRQTLQSGLGHSGAAPRADATSPDEAQAIRQNLQQLQ